MSSQAVAASGTAAVDFVNEIAPLMISRGEMAMHSTAMVLAVLVVPG
jgi:hypothetical protein